MAASEARPSGKRAGKGNGRFRGLLPRVLSALVLAPLALAALWYGFPWIDLLAAIAAPLMAMEWLRLTRGRPIARLLGLAYVLAAVVALLWLRHQPVLGRETVVWLMVCVWATDIGGFFVGRAVGGARLAPSISPGKTWSGLIGGMCWSAVASAICGLIFDRGDTWTLAFVGAALAAVDQAGDLLESHAKRRAGVKDSGNLIPGHGGLLDRVDGLIAVLVAVALARLAFGGDWPW
jgi:phosphatidate cytidylyltransferase